MMRKSAYCKLLLDYYPRISDDKDLYSTNIASCAFNIFLCYTAIMLNIVTMHALRKTSSLPRTLKTLFLSIAVSDVGVSLLGQPILVSVLVKRLQEDNPGCNTCKTFHIIAHLFSLASYSGVLTVSVDRFLAIHLHLRYQELVTHNRVVAAVVSIWALSVFLSFLTFWVQNDIFSLIKTITGVVGVLLTTMIYIRIYLTARSHKNQIQALQVQQEALTEEETIFSSLIKSAAGIFYVYLVFLICYLPYSITLAAFKINGPSITLKKLFLFSQTLVFLN